MTTYPTASRILAVDIGTSSVRAAVFDARGTMAGSVKQCYGVIRPAPFMEEQNPDEVRAHVFETIRACLAKAGDAAASVRGVVFSSQMYGVFPVDCDGRAMANSILWSDGRAEAQADALRASGAAEEMYRVTGCPVNSIYPLAKLIWLARHRPELFAAARYFVSIKDYVIAPMAGRWVADHSMASATGLLDIRTQKWSSLALAAAGIKADRLCEPVSGEVGLPFVNDELRASLGLPHGAMIYPGGGDGPLANLGAGAGEVGAVNIDIGTSAAARAVVDRVTTDPDARLWCYNLVPGRWAFGGILTNAGNAYQWLATNLAAFLTDAPPEAIFARLDSLAAEVKPGADGLLFMPYFAKVRSPYWDNSLRGTLTGLTARHDLRHVARALLEALAFDLSAIVDIAAERVAVKAPLILTGGLARSPLLPQILADVSGREIRVPDTTEGSLAGAAIVGLRGAGLLETFAFDRPVDARATCFLPDIERHGTYRAIGEDYAALVATMQDHAKTIRKKPS